MRMRKRRGRKGGLFMYLEMVVFKMRVLPLLASHAILGKRDEIIVETCFLIAGASHLDLCAEQTLECCDLGD